MEKVYILDFGNRIKIGFTSNIDNRISAIENQSGCKVIRKYYLDFKNARSIEKRMHNIFKDYRALGEYFIGIDFDIIKEQLIKFSNIYNKDDSNLDDNLIKLKYKFIMMNIDIETIKTLENKIKPERTLQVLKLIHTLGYYNEIDFTILGLSEGGLNKFRAKLSKEGIVKKLKIGEKSGYKWYLNPLYFNRGKIKEELYQAFNDINGNIIY